MTEVHIDALADTLAKAKAETLGDKLADVDGEGLCYADTVAEVEAETLYNTPSDMEAETLVEALDHTLTKNRGRDTW